jgi:phage terminase large subunit GpA-like protein
VTALFETVIREAIPTLASPPDLTVSAWADAYRFLSSESSAEPGRWRTDRAPYQRGILDAANDPTIREVVVMSSAQVGKTELILNLIGYYIHQDPSPILLLQPTLEMAESFSKDRLAPMVRDTPALTGKIADPKARDSGNTMLHKKFPGGQITMAGANSPASLASRPIRVVLCDEVDRYPLSAGTEGDPVSLARKRTNTFWNRKIILTSTPTVAGISRIEAAYARSDRREFHVPCPHCDHLHTLKWKNVLFDEANPSAAVMACPECGGVITDQDKVGMLKRGRWIPGGEFTGIAGFHINELYSPWRKFSDVVDEFIAAKDYPEKLKTWINTSLGEVWEDRDGDKISDSDLMNRKSTWSATTLPAETSVVTAGVDTQDDRLECTRVAWLDGKRSRFISHHVINGSPGEPATWAKLDALLKEPMTTEAGVAMHVAAVCVDAGGHHAAGVFDYCKSKSGRRIWAVRGKAGAAPAWPIRASKSAKHKGNQQWMIGVDTIKDFLRSALAVEGTDKPHSVEWSSDQSFDERYFRQFVAERRVLSYDKQGRPVRTWKAKSGARVEAWDCAVYATAAMEGLREMYRVTLRKPIVKKDPRPSPAPADDEVEVVPLPSGKKSVRRRSGGFVGGWK